MIKRRFLLPDEFSRPSNCGELPLVFENTSNPGSGESQSLREVLASSREDLKQDLLQYGAILFRGFDLNGPDAFREAVEAFGFDPLKENPFDTSPRRNVADRVFTSTDANDAFPILAHNENCFLKERPKWIAFFCQTEPPCYGETPIFDSRRAAADLDGSVRERLMAKKVIYRRRLPRRRKPWAPSVVRTWKESFGTEDREEIEALISRQGLTCRWDPRGRLVFTESVVPPLPSHPDTGEPCLNIQGFHHDSIMEDIKEVRSRQNWFVNTAVRWGTGAIYRVGAMPVTFHWGDGSDISTADALEMRRAIWDQSVLFRWRKGDLLILDNFLTAHGRMNVVQPRKILTAFSDPVTIG